MTTWTTIKSAAELESYFAAVAKLDCRFSTEQKKFYASRTKAQLDVLAAQAWYCNDSEGYMMARSYRNQCGE